mgnify:CR=1 FL=1
MARPLEGIQYKSLTNRISILRRALGLSRKQLAAKTFISIYHIKNLETEKVNMSTDSLSRIAQALECTADYLLGLSDDPGPKWKNRPY